MKNTGVLYTEPTIIEISNGQFVCTKGVKLKIIRNCFDESYLHEITNYWRESLKEKKLSKGDIVEVLGCWSNFYGSYVKCVFNNEKFDINPDNLAF